MYMAKDKYKQFNCTFCGFSIKAKTEEELLEHIKNRHMGFDWRWVFFPNLYRASGRSLNTKNAA